jgi:DNA-binding response OmpR family regulator
MATIVIVEADFAIRMLLAEWLIADGYTVDLFSHLTATGGALVSADLLIVDLPSPRLQQGTPLAEMNSTRPGLAAIGLSTSLSRSLGGDSAISRSLGLACVLAKPCERLELLGAVRDVLGQRRA